MMTSELARHSTMAPFACNAPLVLRIEQSALRQFLGRELVVERCSHCGRVVNVWRVLPVEEMAHDEPDDCT